MTTRLSLYNDALLICGESLLSALTEEREPRRLLDQAWNSGAVKACLESSQWYFAMRTVQVDYDPDIEPDFGYRRAFTKPSDWVSTSAVCSDEFFVVPLLRYVDEAGLWYSDLDTIYVRFVSDDDNYGGDLSRWPQAFADYVSAHLAERIILKLTSDADRVKLVEGAQKKRLSHAKSNNAMAGPVKFPAEGRWIRSRRGSRYRDGGSRSTLIS